MKERETIIFIDLGDQTSVCSSLYIANLLSQKIDSQIEFYISKKFSNFADYFPAIKVIPVELGETLAPREELVFDFTPLGYGKIANRFYNAETHYFYIESSKYDECDTFQSKIDFLQKYLSVGLLAKKTEPESQPVLTFSPQLAAFLNMRNIPTVELQKQGQRAGSFLPKSLVIQSDNFYFQDSEELAIIFNFYQKNKIEQLMHNKSVLEADWKLTFYKYEEVSNCVVSKKYPVSATEDFFHTFLKVFIVTALPSNTSMESLLKVADQMDYIDLDMSIDFLKKSLALCIEDIESENFPLVGSYWNLVRSYLDQDMYQSPQKVLRVLNQALIGLDLFVRIEERQRRVSGMH